MDAGMEAWAMEQRLYVWDMRQQASIGKRRQDRPFVPNHQNPMEGAAQFHNIPRPSSCQIVGGFRNEIKSSFGGRFGCRHSCGLWHIGKSTRALDGQIHGTDSCDAAVYTKVIAMDSRDGNAFYYADSQNNLYIKGAFEKIDENVYAVSCDSAAGKAAIPDQSIVYSHRSFLLTVSGQQLLFRKVHQAPILYGDETVYE